MFDEIIVRMAEFDSVAEARNYVLTIIVELVKIKKTKGYLYNILLTRMTEHLKGKGNFKKEIDGYVKDAIRKGREEVFNEATGDKQREKFDTNEDGVVIGSQNNIVRLLEDNKFLVFSYDTFTEQMLFRFIGQELWHEGLQKDYLEFQYPHDHSVTGLRKNRWYRVSGHLSELKLYLHEFFPAERSWQELGAALEVVCKRNQFDLYMDWMDNGLPEWDFVDRMDFLARYAGVTNREWARVVGHSIMLTLVFRCYEPGYDVRGAPIFEGPENQGKSWLTRTFAFDERFATHYSFSKNDEGYEPARKLRGRVVVEFPDKGGIDSKNPDQVKAFLTFTHDVNRRMHTDDVEDLKRRFVTIITCNESGAYLKGDADGDTRFEPIRFIGKVDVEGVKSELAMLYAQAKYLYETGLVDPRLTEAEQKLQKEFVEPRQLKSDYYYLMLPILRSKTRDNENMNNTDWDGGFTMDKVGEWCSQEAEWFSKTKTIPYHQKHIAKAFRDYFHLDNEPKAVPIKDQAEIGAKTLRKWRYNYKVNWKTFLNSLED